MAKDDFAARRRFVDKERKYQPVVMAPAYDKKTGERIESHVEAIVRLPSGVYFSGQVNEAEIEITDLSYFLTFKGGISIDFKQVSRIEILDDTDPLKATHSRVVASDGRQTRHLIIPVAPETIHKTLHEKSEVPVLEFVTEEGRSAFRPILPQGRAAVFSGPTPENT